MSAPAQETTTTEAKSRDSAATTPPSPPPSILEKSVSSESRSSSPQHHVKMKCPGIPPISPRAHHKERNHSFKGGLPTALSHSPTRKDRSMSLGAYPPSWRDLSSSNIHMPPPPPIVPYSPSASPITSTSMYASGNISAANSMPCMPHLSHSHQTRTAMEAAVHSERMRTKQKQQEEENFSADELRVVLKQERIRMSKIQADLAAMRAAAVQCQAEAEVHEEGRINNLMRRVECLQQEKGRIIVELEREEEMLTNTLQKKLNQVKREKALLEQQIEREESSHGKLKTKLTTMRDTMEEMEEAKKDDNEEKVGEQQDTMMHPATIQESDNEGQEDDEEAVANAKE